jgi:hypothetical protein
MTNGSLAAAAPSQPEESDSPRLTPGRGAMSPLASFPRVTTPDPVVQAMVAQVQQETIRQYTGDLSGEWDVMIRGESFRISTRNMSRGKFVEKATQYAGDHLAERDLTVEYHKWGNPETPNVIGELRGESRPGDIFMIMAHLDDLPTASYAPGADDNASGSVGVMVTADVLSQHRWECTLRFALWTGEESGMEGSSAYVSRANVQQDNILGVLNLDMIGWNTTGSVPEIDLHALSTLPATVELATQFASVVEAYNIDLVPQVVTNGTGSSDHAPFWESGYTAILAMEDYYPSNHDFNPDYHTDRDTLDKLDMGYYTEFVKAAVASTAHMTGCRVRGPAVAAGYTDAGLTLRWATSVTDTQYEVHRATDPYFSPAPDTRLATANPPFTDPLSFLDATSAAGEASVNHFYVVRAMDADGRGATSGRTGEFDFPLLAP